MKLQKQTLHNSCLSACVAMLTGRPVEEVTAQYHDLIWSGMPITEVLRQEGVPFQELSLKANQVWFGRVYLACVPSLNLPGSFHAIIIDARGDEMEVLDPAPEGKQQYTAENLHSWILECEVVPSS